MGLFDRNRLGMDTSLPVDPYEGQRQTPGFFGKGRKLQDAIGYGLGALSEQLGGSNPYQQGMDREADQQHLMAMLRLKQQMQGGPEDSPYIRDAEAIGLKRGTPEFARWVTRMRSAPRIVTNDSGIYNMDTDDYGLGWGQGGGPQTQVIDGKTYYNINGKWFDNPEGR